MQSEKMANISGFRPSLWDRGFMGQGGKKIPNKKAGSGVAR